LVPSPALSRCHVRAVKVQTHEVEAQHPDPQRLVVPGQHCPAEVVKARRHAWQRYRCRCGCVSSCPFRTTASLPHPGQRTPSGQRCWRTKAKHFASSSRDARLTGSTVAIMTGPPCSPATADRLKSSSYLNPPPQASITQKPTRAKRYCVCDGKVIEMLRVPEVFRV
jgi:hypothetical protein